MDNKTKILIDLDTNYQFSIFTIISYADDFAKKQGLLRNERYAIVRELNSCISFSGLANKFIKYFGDYAEIKYRGKIISKKIK